MRKVVTTVLTGLLASFLSVCGAMSAEITSLRGDVGLTDESKMFASKKQRKMEGGFDRAWKLQPPTIPHSVEKDRITLKENTCMRCHSEANYEKEKAPKIGDSHYVDRDGKELPTFSKRRYFCDQCHVPQKDAAPLVENTF